MIRVSDATKPVVYDESQAFMMKGVLTAVTSPVLNDELTVGVAKNIAWTTRGTADYGALNLSYSSTGTAPWTPITTVAYDASPYTLWAPGSADISTAAKIRIEDADNVAEVNIESDPFFVGGLVSIVSPAGGNIRYAGVQEDIVWDRTGEIGVVTISFSTDDGQNYTVIANGVASPLESGNVFPWTPPIDNIVSSQARIKIDGPSLIAPAITPQFTIKGNLKLDYPNVAGIVLNLGDTLNVQWTTKGDIGPVKVEYSDNGTDYTTVTSAAPQGGPRAFALDADFLPGGSVVGTTTATSTARIRISDADDSSVEAISANPFTVKPYLLVTSPTGGDEWVVGSPKTITWDYKGSNVPTVKVEYSNDNFVSNFNVLFGGSTANDGTEPWTIPDDIQPTANLKLKVSSLPLASPYANTAISGGNFQIIGALEMVQPDDTTGVNWTVDTSGNEVKWNATGSIINARLEYSTDSGNNWSTLVASTPSGVGSNKSYSWTIPPTTPIAKNTVRIRVLDAANTNVLDESTALSSFKAKITVDEPLGGWVWVATTSRDIKWTTPVGMVLPNVFIEYSLDDGVNWYPLPESPPDGADDGIVTNNGSRPWTLGPELATVARVRISDPSDPSSAVVSGAFKIRGDLTLTAPNTGQESWEVGTEHNITWTKLGNISAVKLEVTSDADAPIPTYLPLVDGNTVPQDTQNIDVTGAGPIYTFNWKIADVAGLTSTKARIRVADASDSLVFDDSNANFTIKGRVELNNPNGGGDPQQTLTVGESYTIDGVVLGAITNVKLFYATDGLAFVNPVLGCETVAVSAGTFSCSWGVPDALGSSLKIRAEDANNAAVFDVSDDFFTIGGGATITSPTGSSLWYAGNEHPIIWSRNGSIGNVDLTYSVDGGPDNPIASSIPSPLGSGNTYLWTLPSQATDNIISPDVKIKVDGINLVIPYETAGFTVKGKIDLVYPDVAGIVLSLGDTLNIDWDAAGNMGLVKVEYASDGTNFLTITSTAPQGDDYPLLLDTPSVTVATANAKVRVSDADDASVTDTSANAFMVKPYLLVTSPVGGDEWVVDSLEDITWEKKGSNVSDVNLNSGCSSIAHFDS